MRKTFRVCLSFFMLFFSLGFHNLLAQTEKDILNIANGAVVVFQTSFYDELWDGLLLLDDATETGWCSRDNSFPQEIEISLPQEYILNKFEIDNTDAQENRYPGISAKDFELWIAPEGQDYQKILNESATQGDLKSFSLDQIKAKRIKLVVLSNYGYELYTELMELNAFGEATNEEPALRSIDGTYNTNYGLMNIKSEGTNIYGCYEHDEGKMRGTQTGNVIQFEWSETGGKQIGTAVMALTDDNLHLNGLWYELGTYKGLWNGKRTIENEKAVCEVPTGTTLGAHLEKSGRVILYGILFDYDSDQIKTVSEPTLDNILNALNKSPGLELYVDGHTDDLGSESYNNKLSKQRAISVINWLMNKGIESNRLIPRGWGESRPVANNKSEQGRKLNRRVELITR